MGNGTYGTYRTYETYGTGRGWDRKLVFGFARINEPVARRSTATAGYSAEMWAPFSTTERRMKGTMKERRTPATEKRKKQSK
jgi:hypothetical protein